MNALLPSEIARLVLGYLTSTKCNGARAKFLEESPHLREYIGYLKLGHEYPTTIFGRDLVHYLNAGYSYTQYLSCGDPMKYPVSTAQTSFPPYYAYPPRQNFMHVGPSLVCESFTQPAFLPRNGTPVSSPRGGPGAGGLQSTQSNSRSRTPRDASLGSCWAGFSPAVEGSRRSPSDSVIIDISTITEPPSSESHGGLVPPASKILQDTASAVVNPCADIAQPSADVESTSCAGSVSEAAVQTDLRELHAVAQPVAQIGPAPVHPSTSSTNVSSLSLSLVHNNESFPVSCSDFLQAPRESRSIGAASSNFFENNTLANQAACESVLASKLSNRGAIDSLSEGASGLRTEQAFSEAGVQTASVELELRSDCLNKNEGLADGVQPSSVPANLQKNKQANNVADGPLRPCDSEVQRLQPEVRETCCTMNEGYEDRVLPSKSFERSAKATSLKERVAGSICSSLPAAKPYATLSQAQQTDGRVGSQNLLTSSFTTLCSDARAQLDKIFALSGATDSGTVTESDCGQRRSTASPGRIEALDTVAKRPARSFDGSVRTDTSRGSPTRPSRSRSIPSSTALFGSPKRKLAMPKKRTAMPLNFCSFQPDAVDSSNTENGSRDAKRQFDDYVQNLFAERLAETINKAFVTSSKIISETSSANAFRKDGISLSFASTMENTSDRSSTSSQERQNSFCELAISRALSDPVVEELTQYMANKSGTSDLHTPSVTPLKEDCTLKTPFKQIVEELVAEEHNCQDSPALIINCDLPATPSKSFCPVSDVEKKMAPSVVTEDQGNVVHKQSLSVEHGVSAPEASGSVGKKNKINQACYTSNDFGGLTGSFSTGELETQSGQNLHAHSDVAERITIYHVENRARAESRSLSIETEPLVGGTLPFATRSVARQPTAVSLGPISCARATPAMQNATAVLGEQTINTHLAITEAQSTEFVKAGSNAVFSISSDQTRVSLYSQAELSPATVVPSCRSVPVAISSTTLPAFTVEKLNSLSLVTELQNVVAPMTPESSLSLKKHVVKASENVLLPCSAAETATPSPYLAVGSQESTKGSVVAVGLEHSQLTAGNLSTATPRLIRAKAPSATNTASLTVEEVALESATLRVPALPETSVSSAPQQQQPSLNAVMTCTSSPRYVSFTSGNKNTPPNSSVACAENSGSIPLRSSVMSSSNDMAPSLVHTTATSVTPATSAVGSKAVTTSTPGCLSSHTAFTIRSSPVGSCLPKPPVLRTAPRKPSPKSIVSDSTGSTWPKESSSHVENTLQSAPLNDFLKVNDNAGLSIDASKTCDYVAGDDSTKPGTGRKPSRRPAAAAPGPHVRALDFGGLADCARRFPNLYRNLELHGLTMAASPDKPKEHNARRCRKRKLSSNSSKTVEKQFCYVPPGEIALDEEASGGNVNMEQNSVSATMSSANRHKISGTPVLPNANGGLPFIEHAPTCKKNDASQACEETDSLKPAANDLPSVLGEEDSKHKNAQRRVDLTSRRIVAPRKSKQALKHMIALNMLSEQIKTAPARVPSGRPRPQRAARFNTDRLSDDANVSVSEATCVKEAALDRKNKNLAKNRSKALLASVEKKQVSPLKILLNDNKRGSSCAKRSVKPVQESELKITDQTGSLVGVASRPLPNKGASDISSLGGSSSARVAVKTLTPRQIAPKSLVQSKGNDAVTSLVNQLRPIAPKQPSAPAKGALLAIDGSKAALSTKVKLITRRETKVIKPILEPLSVASANTVCRSNPSVLVLPGTIETATSVVPSEPVTHAATQNRKLQLTTSLPATPLAACSANNLNICAILDRVYKPCGLDDPSASEIKR